MRSTEACTQHQAGRHTLYQTVAHTATASISVLHRTAQDACHIGMMQDPCAMRDAAILENCSKHKQDNCQAVTLTYLGSDVVVVFKIAI